MEEYEKLHGLPHMRSSWSFITLKDEKSDEELDVATFASELEELDMHFNLELDEAGNVFQMEDALRALGCDNPSRWRSNLFCLVCSKFLFL